MTSPAMAALGVVAMMVAMMLPSVAPTLWRYHRQLQASAMPQAMRYVALVATGYTSVWVAIAIGLYAISTLLPRIDSPRASCVAGAVVLCAGALQRSRWKAAQLYGCVRACLTTHVRANGVGAWRAGCELGVHCGLSCSAAMAVLLVAGLMDMRMMLIIAAAITAERVTPAGQRIARLTGTIAMVVGLGICVRALGIAFSS